MKIRTKLFTGFSLILIIMLLMGFAAIYFFNQNNQIQEEVIQRSNLVEYILQKEIEHLVWMNELADTIITEENNFQGELDHTQCDFGQWYYQSRESELYQEGSREFQSIFDKIEEPHMLLHQSAERIMTALEEENSTLAEEIYQQDTQVYVADVQEYFNEIKLILQEEAAILEQEAESNFSFARQVLIASIIVAIILSILIVIFLNKGITKPINDVVDMLKSIAKEGGDLTRRLDDTASDETGELAKWFNQFLSKLNKIMLQVSGSAELVNNSSDEISVGNQDLSQRTQEQASSVEEISSTVEEVSSSIKQVANSSLEGEKLAGQTLEVVQEGKDAVAETQSSMQQISDDSEKIANIISTVNDIAFQTNLLALNAAVEAARAGEQGRGFAVVAAEVRNLAGRTAESAKEIEKLISTSVERIRSGNVKVERAASILEEVLQNTENTNDVVSEIAAAMREQATATDQITTTLENLNQVTQQNASMVEEIASSSEAMSSEANNLQGLVDQFKLGKAADKEQKKKSFTKKKAKKPVEKPKLMEENSQEDDFDLDLDDFEKF
ncbi:MAG: methyl-accepting chemotaxis protein [bacterium]